ncbi:class E sortase [bacterium]|nr:MAG: class E sortase [bacterium]
MAQRNVIFFAPCYFPVYFAFCQTKGVPRFWKPLSSLLIGGGVILALWPFGQTLYGKWSQRSLAAEFQKEEAAAMRVHKPKSKPVQVAAPRKANIAPWPLTKITIPDIDLDAYVVQGWDNVSLRRGPGHYENSSALGEGNCVIAGHRNVYGSPFANLDRLLPGASIILENKNGSFNYVVDSTTAVSASDWSVTKQPPAGSPASLTLMTCTIPHTPSRVIVKAYLSQ